MRGRRKMKTMWVEKETSCGGGRERIGGDTNFCKNRGGGE